MTGPVTGTATEAPLPTVARLGYAAGGAVAGAFATTIGLLMIPYLTEVLGLGPALCGVLVLGTKVCDVLMSPVAGRLSDRTQSRRGARRPFLAVAGPALGIAFAGAFAVPLRGAPGLVYVIVMFLVADAAFAVFQVPYAAMPAEITDSEHERARLMTWRVAVLAIGSLAAGGIAPLIVDGVGGGAEGYRWMGIAVGGLIAASALTAFAGTAAAPLGRVYPTETNLRRQLDLARGSRAFRQLLVCFVVQSTGIGCLLVGVRFFADVVWHDRPATAPLFVAFIGPAVLFMAPWIAVGHRLGKVGAYRVGSLILAGSTAVLVFGELLPRAVVYGVVVVAGIGYAGLQVFAQALLPDRIADDAARSGRRQAGVYTGLWTAGQSLGMGAGALLFSTILQITHDLSPARTGAGVAPAASHHLGVVLGFTVVPSVLVGGALLVLRDRPLTTPPG